MENQVTIFSSEQFGEINDWEIANKREYMGVVYVLEYGDDVKIGCTMNPYKRISLLKHQAEDYHNVKIGRVGITPFHTNYTDNEAMLHIAFADSRIQGTELFTVSFEDVVSYIEDCGIKLLDESEEIKRRIDNSLDGFKHFMLCKPLKKYEIKQCEVMSFNNEQFGEIRVVNNGMILFCGFDVAKALGYANPDGAISAYAQSITPCYVDINNEKQLMLCISVLDVYRLISISRLINAKEFAEWIEKEILPVFRKDCAYIKAQNDIREMINCQSCFSNATKLAMIDDICLEQIEIKGNMILQQNSTGKVDKEAE